MAEVTITIPNDSWTVANNRIFRSRADGHISLGTALSTDGNTELFFGFIRFARDASYTPGVSIRLASSSTGDPFVAGPEFSTQMETAGTITFTASNNDSLTVTGIGDSTEPYDWDPSNIAEVRTFANTLEGLDDRSLTVVFNDNAPPEPDENGDITIEIPNAGWVLNATQIRWSPQQGDFVSLGSAFSGDSPQIELFLGGLRLPTASTTAFQIELANSQTQDETIAGPMFSDQMESSGEITLTASDGSSVSIVGIGDATEPYDWIPSNIAAINRFAETVIALSSRAITATFNDNSTRAIAYWQFATPEPTVGLNVTVAHEVDAGDASFAYAIPEPTVDHTIPVPSLSDFDQTNLDVEALAVIQAGDSTDDLGGNNGVALYTAAGTGRWETSGALIDGELTAGPITISRISRLGVYRTVNFGVLRFNDDPDADSISNYFGTGGAGNNLSVYIQVDDTVEVHPMSQDIIASGGNWINFDISDAMYNLLVSVTAGRYFIFALARTRYQVDPDDASHEWTLPEPSITLVSTFKTVDAGDVAHAWNVPEPAVTRMTDRVSLFDSVAANPGADGDVSVRWIEPFTAFATTANDTRAHLIANNLMANGVTPATFQDRGENDKRIDWLVLHHTNRFVILNLDSSVTNDTETNYRVAFRDRGSSQFWEYELSADSNDADPYEMPAPQADLTAIVAVITGGGTLDTIIYDFSVASALPSWNAADYSYIPAMAHEVDPGDALWTFALPEPSATHNRSHEESAGAVAHAWAVPEPAVTHTVSTVTMVTVDLGDDQDVRGDLDYTMPGMVTVTNGVGATTYLWQQLSGVDIGTLSSTTALNPTIHTSDVAANTVTTWRLTATNNGVSDSDTITLTITPHLRAPSFPSDSAPLHSWQVGTVFVVDFPIPNGNPTPVITLEDTPPNSTFVVISGTQFQGLAQQSGTGTVRVVATNSEGTDTYLVPYSITGYPPRNAGDVDWLFDVPVPSVDHDRAHEISANPTLWTFALPQPTVTSGYVPVARAVDAGDVSWLFNLPIPSTDHDQLHDISPNAAEYQFAVPNIPRAGVTHTQVNPINLSIAPIPATVVGEQQVQLDVTVSHLNDEDLTFFWTTSPTNTGSFNDANIEDPIWTAPDPASPLSVILALAVTDGTNSASANVSTTVLNNRNPAVTLTADRTSVEPNDVVALTSVATDPDGDDLTYQWLVNPAGGSLDNNNQPNNAWRAPEVSAQTQYGITVIVRDDAGLPGSSTVPITVMPRSGTAMDVDAGDVVHEWNVPEPSVTRTGAIITLADFTVPDGITMDMLALYQAGTPSGNVVVDLTTNPQRGALLDGDNVIEYSNGETSVIGEVRVTPTGESLGMLDTLGVASFVDYFANSDDEYGNSIFFLQVGSNVYSISHADGFAVAFSDSLTWNIIGVDNHQIAQSVRTTGIRFILGIGRPTPVSYDVDAGDISHTWATIEPTVAITHHRDAGDVTHTWQVPEPSIDFDEVHEVSPNAANWTFALPQPSVQLGAYVPVDRTADAGDITHTWAIPEPAVQLIRGGIPAPAQWAFAVPQPTVTHVQPQAYTVDAGDVTWLFALPQPARTAAFTVEAGDVSHTWAVPQPGLILAPEAPTGLMVQEQGLMHLIIGWTTPDDNNSPIIRYEYSLNNGAWQSTASTTTMVRIAGLTSGTSYGIRVRAVNAQGAGAPSSTLSAETAGLTRPGRPRSFAAFAGGRSGVSSHPSGTVVELTWTASLQTDTDDPPVEYYEIVIWEDGQPFRPNWERTEDDSTSFTVRGLAVGHTYRVRIRAVSSAGAGEPSEDILITPDYPRTEASISGQTIPLVDTSRQSLIVRLEGKDIRLTVFWQPLDSSWCCSVEIPVNTPVVRGRRLINGASLLDRAGILDGAIVLRATSEDYAGRNPERNAWALGTHVLRYEP